MNKKLKRLFGILLIGVFVLIVLRQVFGSDVDNPRFQVIGPDGWSMCTGSVVIPCTECDSTPYCTNLQRNGWFTRPSPTPFTCQTLVDYPCEICCETNACGICTRNCSQTCQKCTLQPDMETIYECRKCLTFEVIPSPTPCQRCIEAAAGRSCQCSELKPVKDTANHKLSFECLVVGSENAQITDYAMTFKKPDDSLINLESENVEPIECPSSAPQNRTCYQVKTTAIDTIVKGSYEMVIPPQIVCQ